MRSPYLIIINFCCLLISKSVLSQTPLLFEYVYPTSYPSFEEGNTVSILEDGYLISSRRQLTAGNSDVFFMKTDLLGNIVWQQHVIDPFTSIELKDSEIIADHIYLCGQHLDTASKFSSIFLKADSSGSILFYKIVGDSVRNNTVRCMVESEYGGFLLGGEILDSVDATRSNHYFIKVDTAGNVQWTSEILNPDSLLDQVWNIISCDNFYYAIGTTKYTLGSGKIHFLQLDSTGTLVWDTTYSFPPNLTTRGFDLLKSLDGGFLLAGVTGSAGVAVRGIIIKINNSGQIQWTKLLSEFPDGTGSQTGSSIFSIVELYDSSIVATGSLARVTGLSPPYHVDLLIYKVDKVGSEIWRRYYSGLNTNDSFGSELYKTDDAGFVVIGHTFNNNTYDNYLLKTNCLGFVNHPHADYSVAWNGNLATFTNLSEFGDTCIYYFGDGDSLIVLLSDTVPISHQYSSGGPWAALLVVYACGEADTILQNISTALDDDSSEEFVRTINIYPNPANNILNINYKISKNSIVEIKIYDIFGKIVDNKTFVGTQKNAEIILTSLVSGQYILEFSSRTNVLGRFKLSVIR